MTIDQTVEHHLARVASLDARNRSEAREKVRTEIHWAGRPVYACLRTCAGARGKVGNCTFLLRLSDLVKDWVGTLYIGYVS